MAVTNTTAAPTNATAAEFRAWAQFIHDVFANGGWVQTADTGQIDLTTVAAPGAANTKMGYEIWRMADSHQSAHPILLKLAYGSGSVTTHPAIWFMVGTGSDGAGNLVGADGLPAYLVNKYTQSAAPVRIQSNPSSSLFECFGSADTGRAVFAAFEGKPVLRLQGSQCEIINVLATDRGGQIMVFSIERGRDADGNVDPEHLYLIYNADAQTVLNSSLCAKTSDDWLPADSEYGISSQVPRVTAVEAIYRNYTNHVSGGLQLPSNATAFPVIMFQQNTKPAWPGLNVMMSHSPLFEFSPSPGSCGSAADVGYLTGRTAAVAPYGGTARTYRTVAGIRAGAYFAGAGGQANGVYIWILYE